MRIETGATGNFILGNFIGTDSDGAPSPRRTILGMSESTEIYGDANFVIGNVIGGITDRVDRSSVQAGVSLREDANNNVIQGNWIGVDKSGTDRAPNGLGVLCLRLRSEPSDADRQHHRRHGHPAKAT